MSDFDTDDKILERARACYKIGVAAEADQRQREREDLLFQLPENQWTDAAKAERSGGNVGGQEIPPRPMLSISLLKQPMQLVYNQFTKARLGVNLHPVGENANKELAEIKQGIYRRIERDGGADEARGWAFLRALACGRGWYRINSKYDEDADPTGPGAWDQEIVYERILHQEAVYMDPSAQKADYSDAKWAFVVAWLSKRDFKDRYPNSMAAKASGVAEWEGLDMQAPGWVNAAADDAAEKGILIAEYWWVQEKRETIRGPQGQERERVQREVYCAKINGAEVLEKPILWDGQYIPLVPVLGEELIPVDGKRIQQGMIRPARDGQMAYNYAISSAVEDISRVSKAPYVGASGSFEGHPEWKTANVRNHPYLEYELVTSKDGATAPPPAPMPVDGTKMQLSFQLAEQARRMVQSATAIYEPSLGNVSGSQSDNPSGRMVLALQQQADAGTSQFVQNLVNVSLRHEARIILDLMPKKYDRPGRVTAIVTGEEESRSVMLGVPYVSDPNTGAPQEVPEGTQGAKFYDLSQGRYGISSDIGKSHQTRLEAGQAFLTEIVAARPELMDVAGDLFFKFRDEPGAKELAERLRKVIQAGHPGLIEDAEGSAEQAKAQMQALQQQAQQLGQQLQQAMQVIQTKQVEQMAKLEAEKIRADVDLKTQQMKVEADIQLQEMKNLGAITVAQINAAAKGVLLQTEAENEAHATGLEHAHEEQIQNKEHAHDMAMAASGAQTMSMSRDAGQDNEQEEGMEQSESPAAPEEAAEA